MVPSAVIWRRMNGQYPHPVAQPAGSSATVAQTLGIPTRTPVIRRRPTAAGNAALRSPIRTWPSNRLAVSMRVTKIPAEARHMGHPAVLTATADCEVGLPQLSALHPESRTDDRENTAGSCQNTAGSFIGSKARSSASARDSRHERPSACFTIHGTGRRPASASPHLHARPGSWSTALDCSGSNHRADISRPAGGRTMAHCVPCRGGLVGQCLFPCTRRSHFGHRANPTRSTRPSRVNH
jgi:hypothetical protein